MSTIKLRLKDAVENGSVVTGDEIVIHTETGNVRGHLFLTSKNKLFNMILADGEYFEELRVVTNETTIEVEESVVARNSNTSAEKLYSEENPEKAARRDRYNRRKGARK